VSDFFLQAMKKSEDSLPFVSTSLDSSSLSATSAPPTVTDDSAKTSAPPPTTTSAAPLDEDPILDANLEQNSESLTQLTNGLGTSLQIMQETMTELYDIDKERHPDRVNQNEDHHECPKDAPGSEKLSNPLPSVQKLEQHQQAISSSFAYTLACMEVALRRKEQSTTTTLINNSNTWNSILGTVDDNQLSRLRSLFLCGLAWMQGVHERHLQLQQRQQQQQRDSNNSAASSSAPTTDKGKRLLWFSAEGYHNWCYNRFEFLLDLTAATKRTLTGEVKSFGLLGMAALLNNNKKPFPPQS
jgi:hypothetical protein